MTFEEFFKKKKISLVSLEQGEPGLFSEFKIHFEKMGEKSFDHTKKYWFNKLRARFPAPPEPKVEKVVIENTLAEQTITETLGEKPAQPAPKVGFTPRFKAGATKPAETAPAPEEKLEAEKSEESEKPTSAPAGFKPRFKSGVTKPADPNVNTEPTPEPGKPAETEKSASTPVGFKPRFKAGVTKPVQGETSNTNNPSKEQSATDTPEVNEAAKTKDQHPEFEQQKETAQDMADSTERLTDEDSSNDKPTQDPGSKPGYKPRFNMKSMKSKDDK